LYFYREPVCLYELIREMKYFLKRENLIFVMKEGKEVGFVFWHPDYNEIIPGGKRNSMLGIGLRYLINRNRIKKIKLNAIGVLEEYRNTGAVVGLLYEVYKHVFDRYNGGETNFVWDSNIPSRKLNQHICDREVRHYCVYEMDL